MSGDPIDLDEIEAVCELVAIEGDVTSSERRILAESVPALVAEVRRLRERDERAGR